MSRTLFLIQNSEIEKPGVIIEWAALNKTAVRVIRAFENEAFPVVEDVELAIVLGAPVSIADDLPWVRTEREWLKNLVATDALVLGLCFGAQLLAKELGGNVFPSPASEIGWHEVTFTSFNLAENVSTLFQWHSEEFTLPEGARLLAKSRANACHGFQKRNVTAVASHLEINLELVNAFNAEFWDEKWFSREGRHSSFVQQPEEMQLGLESLCEASRKFAFDFLDLWSEGTFQSETPLRLVK